MNETSFFDIWKILTDFIKIHFKILALGFIFFSSLGITYSLSLNDIYKSEALLIKSETSSLGMGGNSSLGDILNLGSSSDRIELITKNVSLSRDFYLFFINKRKIFPELLATDSYNPKTKKIEYDESIYDSSEDKWIEQNPYENPLKYHNLFKKKFSILFTTKTKTASLNVFHESPYIAQAWAEWFIEDLNFFISSIEVENSKDSFTYLQEKVNQTPIAEVRKQISNLLLYHVSKMEVSMNGKDYAYEVIDSPSLAFEKHAPRRSTIVILFSFFGILLSLTYIFYFEFKKTK